MTSPRDPPRFGNRLYLAADASWHVLMAELRSRADRARKTTETIDLLDEEDRARRGEGRRP
jgi:hypothetical protein